jgi:hypothetical protein
MNRWGRTWLACALTALTASGCVQVGDMPGGNDDGTDGDTTRNLVVFVDPDSDFTTTDVRDVDEEIVWFDADTNEIVWAADDSGYQSGSWTTDGNRLAGGGFTVRFGTKDGERRAYFTETGPATICNIEISNGAPRITATTVTVPQE